MRCGMEQCLASIRFPSWITVVRVEMTVREFNAPNMFKMMISKYTGPSGWAYNSRVLNE